MGGGKSHPVWGDQEDIPAEVTSKLRIYSWLKLAIMGGQGVQKKILVTQRSRKGCNRTCKGAKMTRMAGRVVRNLNLNIRTMEEQRKVLKEQNATLSREGRIDGKCSEM